MTVSQLIEALQNLPGDALVVLQKDGSGNGCSPCVGAEHGRYEAETPWSGAVLSVEDEYYKTRGVPCVVLWPVN